MTTPTPAYAPTTATRGPTSTECEPATSGQLPSTGSGPTPLLVAGVALLTGGLSILLASRRRPAD